jgi:hypothetical protein
LRRKAGKPSPARTFSSADAHAFWITERWYSIFWVAVHDDMGTAAAFSARLRFQSSDRRLTLNCQKVKAAPLADRLIAHGAPLSMFHGGNPLYEKLIARLPTVNSRQHSSEWRLA